MPSGSPISATDLVARFLRTNNYPNTLSAFIVEVGLPDNAGSTGADGDGFTIEKILEEKIAFDKSVNFERVGEEDDESEKRVKWTVPAPSQPTVVWTPSPSNILSISITPSGQSMSERGGRLDGSCSLVATDASRHLNFFDTSSLEYALTAPYSDLADSPILSCIPLRNGRNLALTCLSGKLMVVTREAEIVDERKDHTKYAVQVAAWRIPVRAVSWLKTRRISSSLTLNAFDIDGKGKRDIV